MTNQHHRGGAALAVLTSVALLVGAAGPVAASDVTFDLPAGLGCPSFDLRVEIDAVGPQREHQFTDADGNVVSVLSAGRGNDLTFTNLNTGARYWLDATGSVSKRVLNPDGSRTETVTGMTVLIMFPTDVPAGPSTTLYIGRVVFGVDVNGTFTILSTVGTSVDICATLDD